MLQPTNIARDHPLDTIIGDISIGVQIRSRLASFCEHFSFVIHWTKEDRRSFDRYWLGECYAWRIEQLHKKSSMGISWETKESQCDWNQIGL